MTLPHNHYTGKISAHIITNNPIITRPPHRHCINTRCISYPNYIIHNYRSIEDYGEDLEKLSEEYDYEINIKKEKKLPHYRYFEFKNDSSSFIIRIDGGVAHGLKPIQFLKSIEMPLDNFNFEIKNIITLFDI